MRKLLFLVALTSVSAASVAAQNGYQFDNFDFTNGVRVQTPVVEAAKKTERQGRKLTNSTNFKYTPAPGALTHLTSLTMNPSLGGFTTGNSEVDSFIVESSKRHSVDPLLIYSVMHTESSFKKRALSNKGASGLMQLMPATAARLGVKNIWDPQQNIEGGVKYMRFLLNLFSGDVKLALAGYNAGEGAVMKYGYSVPPYNETQEYVRRIAKRYGMIRDPSAAAHATNLSRVQVAEVQQKDSKPLNVYEPSVFMARTPDGRLQLVSQ